MDKPRKTTSRDIETTIDKVMVFVALVAIFTIVVEWGWGATAVILILNAIVVSLFVFETLARIALADSPLRHIRENLFEVLLTAAFLILLVTARRIYDVEAVGGAFARLGIDMSGFYLLLGQVYLVLAVGLKIIAFQKLLTARGMKPAAVVIGSFLLVILIGTALLSSPHAVAEARKVTEGPPAFVDSLFTATSAVCVTGLIVKETGGYFSLFGQAVILCLIQIGGLGLMTFVTFSALLVGKGMALREQVAMQDVLSYDVMAKLPRLIVYILLVTFVAEAAGAALLYPVWQGNLSTARRLYLSVFHSVSSFCNAGFSLFPTSFSAYRGSIALNAVVTSLIIIGGLGFIVQRNIAARLWRGARARWTHSRLLKSPRAGDRRVFFTLQTRVVLVTTACLLLVGAVLFATLEWNGVLKDLPLKEKALATWFQTVTPRTAGFNTVDFSALRTPTYLVTVVLMFIGASPGGTGGGIKTSTFAILLFTIFSALRHRTNVEAMKRTVKVETARQAVMVAFLGILLVLGGLFVLSLCESGVPFERLLFEEVSAFGTVGLSPGDPASSLSLSASLSWLGKLVIIITMFAGRIGPLTLVIAIAQKRYAVEYEYPTEQIVIG
ncbi:MAG: TrkH family potassium uptake protein [Planctomycetota bacterium]|jgi:trk system potassium uptake protein TrkH